jgi:hypothetical protein
MTRQRRIAPRLALQRIGLSRVSEEILGLMVARHVAEAHRPRVTEDGAVVWISLDELPEWFRGAGAIRVDLCRVTLDQEGWRDHRGFPDR